MLLRTAAARVCSRLTEATSSAPLAALSSWPLGGRLAGPAAAPFSSTSVGEPGSSKDARAYPTRALIEVIRENSGASTAKLWAEVQSGQATSEGLRAIPSKRRMKLLLNFMKKNHKVRAWRPQKKNAFVYRLHPMLLRKETRAAQPAQH
mmetsp:Transcript_3621/g.9136  ORF Transcript_3621/g.9136 Transcript_3621/m.9136 type:complete len:149 (-) Transcript_3621:139-585(-)